MRRLIIPIQLAVVILSLALNGYAERAVESFKNSVGVEFVLIKPGKFQMGSPEDEPGRYSGERSHPVNLTHPFYMQTTEVTQEQWMSLMKKNPSSQKGCGANCFRSNPWLKKTPMPGGSMICPGMYRSGARIGLAPILSMK